MVLLAHWLPELMETTLMWTAWFRVVHERMHGWEADLCKDEQQGSRLNQSIYQ